jgi:hypothetical protein
MRFPFLCGPQQEFDIAAQVIDARSGDVRAVLGSANMIALQHRWE